MDIIDRAMTRCHVVRKPDGLWVARCTIPTRTGEIKVAACANEATMRRVIRSNPAVGFSLGDIVKAARKLARSKAIASALAQANALASGPLGAVLPPGVSQGIRLVYTARKTIVRAKKGDRHAAGIVRRARVAGRPEVRQALNAAIQLFAE